MDGNDLNLRSLDSASVNAGGRSLSSGKPREVQRVALVTGASGGIGLAMVDALLRNPLYARVYAGCRNPEYCVPLKERSMEHADLAILRLDVTDAESIAAATQTIQATGDSSRLDLVINTAGVLHTVAGMRPEKRLSDINTEALLHAYDVNALGAIRLAAAVESLLARGNQPRFISLSARVGSITDNRLGGWYAYRASKAALNMLLRTLAVEWSRTRGTGQHKGIICAAVHPGTVSTSLSDPFTGEHYTGKLFTPAEAANNLLNVIEGLQPSQSGGFFSWDGEEIPF